MVKKIVGPLLMLLGEILKKRGEAPQPSLNQLSRGAVRAMRKVSSDITLRFGENGITIPTEHPHWFGCIGIACWVVQQEGLGPILSTATTRRIRW